MKKYFFLILIFLSGCATTGSPYENDPGWNRPPSEQHQSSGQGNQGSYEKYYQQKQRSENKEDPSFEQFQKQEGRK